MNYEHRIVIGDWSDDGHCKKSYFTFKCSHDESEVKKAYTKACKKCKVSLHERVPNCTAICCNYEESWIPSKQLKALKKLGVDFKFAESLEHNNGITGESELSCIGQDIAYLFFEMVKTQLPDFEYKLVDEKKPINGFWSKDFNHSFGYGCFDN